MNFGEALEALKKGDKVCRSGWNGADMFLVLSPGKDGLESSDFFNEHLADHAESLGGAMNVRPSFMLKTAQDDVSYWAPSGSDALAEDWEIYETPLSQKMIDEVKEQLQSVTGDDAQLLAIAVAETLGIKLD